MYFFLKKKKKKMYSVEYFWQTSRYLVMWSKAVLSIWYVVSIEDKTKEKLEK